MSTTGTAMAFLTQLTKATAKDSGSGWEWEKG
jgi:superoxide dismutase